MKPDTLIGKTVGQYEISSTLGQGGMAVVYRARQHTMKRDVAMKVVLRDYTEDPTFMERFDREVEVIASLEHPHIVPVHEHGVTGDGVVYLTMRYVKGGTLSERIRAEGQLPMEDISRILLQISSALDYAHQRGVIHRDLKPNNILLDEQGDAYLADFGLARLIEADDRLKKALTETGTLLGTPTYISPEQIEEGYADRRSDIYSLGVILFEMMTGRPPFVNDSAFKLMQAHVAEKPPKVRSLREGLPVGMDAVLDRVLEKDPAKRYQTAGELVKDFASAMHGSGSLVPEGLRASERPSYLDTTIARLKSPFQKARPPQRMRLFTAGIIIAIVTLLGLVRLASLLPGADQLVDESQRPLTGVPEDLTFSDAQLAVARERLQGSFIGVMPCTLSSAYHASLARGVITRANALGLATRVIDSEADKFRQPAIIERFLVEGAKAIFICPMDFDSLMPSIRAAQEAGVKVLTTGDLPRGKETVVLTITDERMGTAIGEYAARYINAHLGGKANVMFLDYPPVPGTLVRGQAMEKALLENAPDVNIVGNWPGGLAPNGEQSMKEALAKFPDINVILSINDDGAFGAVKVLQAAGKQPDEIAIFSVDAEPEAKRMIRDREFFVASFDNDPVYAGTLAIDAAVKMLAGGITPQQVLLPGQVYTQETAEAEEEATPLPPNG